MLLVCVVRVGDWPLSVRTNTSVRVGKTITERGRDDTAVRKLFRRESRVLRKQFLSTDEHFFLVDGMPYTSEGA